MGQTKKKIPMKESLTKNKDGMVKYRRRLQQTDEAKKLLEEFKRTRFDDTV